MLSAFQKWSTFTPKQCGYNNHAWVRGLKKKKADSTKAPGHRSCLETPRPGCPGLQGDRHTHDCSTRAGSPPCSPRGLARYAGAAPIGLHRPRSERLGTLRAELPPRQPSPSQPHWGGPAGEDTGQKAAPRVRSTGAWGRRRWHMAVLRAPGSRVGGTDTDPHP